MIEPRERDWGRHANWSKIHPFEPRIPALLAHARAQWASRELLVLDARRLTYGEMEAKSAVLARQLLAAGLGKGSRVGLMLPNDETFIVSWMAITRIGAVAVTLSTLSTSAEILRIAKHADLHLFIGPERYLHHDYVARIGDAFRGIGTQRAPYRLPDAPYLRDVWLWTEADAPAWATRIDLTAEPAVDADLLAAVEAEVASSDPAGIIYTSGSTAEPKGVIHSHGNFMRQAGKLAATYDYYNDERAFASMPFFWVGGITVTVLCIMELGGTILASSNTGSQLLDFLESERTTSVLSWPHIVRALAADPTFAKRDWSRMRSGHLYEAFPPERKLKDPTLLGMALGMTETNGPYSIQQQQVPEDQRGSMGPLMPGIQGRLVEPETGRVIAEWVGGDPDADSGGQVGVMQVRTDTMLLGMVKRERADVFTPDGFYSTGDLCSFRGGHLHFHGRADDMIKASGANVSPREVEAVLLKIEGVASANVSGVPDRARGNVVGAIIVPKPGATLDAEAIRREAARSLSSYKVPRVIVVMDASKVPVMSSSKVDRRALIKLLHDAYEAGSA